MHTQCPSCLTIFRVSAGQLAEGRGQVRCGHCRRGFAALDTLADVLPDAHQPSLRLHPVPSKAIELTQISRVALAPHAALFAPLPPATRAPAVIEPGYGDLTEVFAHELEHSLPPLSAAAVSTESVLASSEVFADVPHPDDALADQARADDLRVDETPPLRFDENGWPIVESPIEPAASVRVPELPVAAPHRGSRDSHRPLDRIAARRAHRAAMEPSAPAFARRRTRPARASSGWGWWIGSTLLLAMLSAQVAWAARDQIMDIAVLRPWLLRACETLQCPLPANPATDSIALAARDVRPHPSVGNALIIGATLVNEADFSQPFPVIEITLADVNERRIGMRRFQPSEYVSDRQTLQRGIPPTGTALFSVEVEDPGKRAVAFEFRFL